jgi:hypothetical protein
MQQQTVPKLTNVCKQAVLIHTMVLYRSLVATFGSLYTKIPEECYYLLSPHTVVSDSDELRGRDRR